jgi:hypothetical protein
MEVNGNLDYYDLDLGSRGLSKATDAISHTSSRPFVDIQATGQGGPRLASPSDL